jgi:hypothetical protein
MNVFILYYSVIQYAMKYVQQRPMGITPKPSQLATEGSKIFPDDGANGGHK